VHGNTGRVVDLDPSSNSSRGNNDWSAAPCPGGPLAGGAPSTDRGPGRRSLGET
jgi:hypothetical protein